MEKIYDLIIIGAGPAGITAGIYAKNFGIDCIILGEEIGGLLNGSYKVDNYPGIFDVTGEDLVKKFKAHQEYLEILLKQESVGKIEKEKEVFRITASNGEYSAKTLILAFGTQVKKLEIKNSEKFENRGVYYQSGHNVSLFKDKIIAIVGGANSAVMKAVKFSEQAKKVYLIYRKDKLRADKIWTDKLMKLKNVEAIYNANVAEISDHKELESVILDNGQEIKIDSLFVEAGAVPNTVLIQGLGIETNELGYIEVSKCQGTNIDGVFAAGDATTGSNGFRQIITACSEGAIAALGALNYLHKK
jgi:thioredoxin reductase (NADPH)